METHAYETKKQTEADKRTKRERERYRQLDRGRWMEKWTDGWMDRRINGHERRFTIFPHGKTTSPTCDLCPLNGCSTKTG